VDALGRACPIPVIELARVVETAAVGDVVEVLSDDPASKVDVPVWCRMRGQRFLSQADLEAGGWAFRVTKVR
jgi:TusA-related sulfurtransferase